MNPFTNQRCHMCFGIKHLRVYPRKGDLRVKDGEAHFCLRCDFAGKPPWRVTDKED